MMGGLHHRLAVVTGASSGIGLQYATQLARDYGCDVVLVSNQEHELQQVAADISEQYGVKTYPLFCDLSENNAAQRVYDYCQTLPRKADILINNAGIFFFNPYTQTSPHRIHTMLQLHVVTVAELCRLFGEDMVRRGEGYILNMSSMSAWMAMPGIQTYNATKAFLYNLSKALWYEWKPYGVHITVATPGAVDTSLFGLNDQWRRIAVALHVSIPPEKLVRRVLKALEKGRKTCMPGLLNHLATPLLKHPPDALLFAVMKAIGKYQHG